jgi:formate dehydrogenase assembly factor FdhD
MDDLVKNLRDLGDHASFEPHMFHTAADRIESQLKLIDASGKVHASMLARIEQLEAALDDVATHLPRAEWHYLKDETLITIGEKKDAD